MSGLMFLTLKKKGCDGTGQSLNNLDTFTNNLAPSLELLCTQAGGNKQQIIILPKFSSRKNEGLIDEEEYSVKIFSAIYNRMLKGCKPSNQCEPRVAFSKGNI